MINDLIKDLTSDKINKNINNKKVLKTFGEDKKFKVYDIYPGAMIMIQKMIEKEDTDILSIDSLRILFMAFTNFEELDSKLLERSFFGKLIKKPNETMKDIINTVLEISNEAIGKYTEAIQIYSELPDDQKDKLQEYFLNSDNLKTEERKRP